jgi:hypothetical protein
MPTPRGLQNIRTLTGKVGKSTLPYMAYLRISHIEMEKARKTRESESARRLIADIAARLDEIEAEKANLLAALNDGHGAPARPQTELKRSTGAFKVRY